MKCLNLAAFGVSKTEHNEENDFYIKNFDSKYKNTKRTVIRRNCYKKENI